MAAEPAPAAPAAPAATPADPVPAGLYSGVMRFKMGTASYPIYAIVLQDGTASLFVRTSAGVAGSAHGFALHGLVVRPRNAVFSAPFTALTQPGYQVGNLPYFSGASGTLNGVVQPGGAITGRFMTPHDTGTFTLSPMAADTKRAASGAVIAGSFDQDLPGKSGIVAVPATVKADGTATAVDKTTRCGVSRTYVIPDPARNAYQIADEVNCGRGAARRYTGAQAFFPKGTGAAWNEGKPFDVDTLVTITDGEKAGYMKVAARRSADGGAAAAVAPANVAGLYHGEMTVAGSSAKYPVFAIVLKDGSASVFATTSMPAPDSPQGFAFRGMMFKPNGADFETPFTPFTQPGNVVAGLEKFPGTPGTLRGQIKPDGSIVGTYTTPVASGTLMLAAMPEEYDRMGSGDDIAGSYYHVITTRGMQIIGYETIKPDGTNVHGDDLLKCPVLQIYTVPDAYHNAYVIENTISCPGRPASKYHGHEAFFPRGTGAAVNGGMPFTTNTILAITEDNRTGFLKIAK